MMRAAQIRAELKERRIDFSDCYDKESLADKLVEARAGRIEGTPLPPPPGAAKQTEFGAQSRQGEAVDMEDVFKAAGWTGEPNEPSPVDTARSPGMNRNFGEVTQADFKKPWTGGAGGKPRRGRYG